MSEDKELMEEIRKRADHCASYESRARSLAIQDIRFANADSDNMWQWENALYNARLQADRPSLTINKVRQHNLQIVNDMRQRKVSPKVKPANNEASYEAAQVYEGIFRHIEYISNADPIYTSAVKTQVEGGIGYWRVTTDYVDGESFDQDIFIAPIKDPFSVYLDPDIKQPDGSDARYAFIFEDVIKEVFEELYPDFKNISGSQLNFGTINVAKDGYIRVCEYYRRQPVEKHIISYLEDPENPDSDYKTIAYYDNNYPEEMINKLLDINTTRVRISKDYKIEWYKIAGDQIIDSDDWLGKYIPIVAIKGEETIIDGILDRKGHTRCLKDPQRMYNYFSSSAVEFTALQTKTPWIAPARAIANYEKIWKDANVRNQAVLVYNDMDDAGNPIDAPQRIVPPTPSQGYLQSMESAKQELMMASGQYEAEMGQKSNEVSGKAIDSRQRQGDAATYHFIDNFSIGILFTAKIILDLIPKIYDVKRVLKILGEDGTEQSVIVDPSIEKAHQSQVTKQGATMIFNPNVGKYDVYVDIGTNYLTKRQEAFNAITQIIEADPNLTPIIGDLLFRNADFPNADKIAERLERVVPAQAKGDAPSANEQKMQQELQELQKKLQELNATLQKTEENLEQQKTKTVAALERNDIKSYEAITKRIAILEKHIITPKLHGEMLHDLAMQEHLSTVNQIQADNEAEIKEQTDNGL